MIVFFVGPEDSYAHQIRSKDSDAVRTILELKVWRALKVGPYNRGWLEWVVGVQGSCVFTPGWKLIKACKSIVIWKAFPLIVPCLSWLNGPWGGCW